MLSGKDWARCGEIGIDSCLKKLGVDLPAMGIK